MSALEKLTVNGVVIIYVVPCPPPLCIERSPNRFFLNAYSFVCNGTMACGAEDGSEHARVCMRVFARNCAGKHSAIGQL